VEAALRASTAAARCAGNWRTWIIPLPNVVEPTTRARQLSLSAAANTSAELAVRPLTHTCVDDNDPGEA